MGKLHEDYCRLQQKKWKNSKIINSYIKHNPNYLFQETSIDNVKIAQFSDSLVLLFQQDASAASRCGEVKVCFFKSAGWFRRTFAP